MNNCLIEWLHLKALSFPFISSVGFCRCMNHDNKKELYEWSFSNASWPLQESAGTNIEGQSSAEMEGETVMLKVLLGWEYILKLNNVGFIS